ncbi:uncharacterized protein ARB_05586 [Trichophyton benhamiae CBS 112371]|uniref:Uncharacterized protein n=1 Tax=Arthroderma benhamiae (strain ATCC MYA-4681 / CBS 112371) TaxID=663331 RepID=D4AMY3_ARTBC|nr:uncharacterized protein ARB_05586 [Trichophyton benhamiae CBS 112371]EFE35544.1 hypothetical protein ARB_05586 [Trichophyton benhamiae CBS 112371]
MVIMDEVTVQSRESESGSAERRPFGQQTRKKKKKKRNEAEDEEEKASSQASERDGDDDDDDDDGGGGSEVNEESTRTGSSNKDGWPAMTYSPSRLQIIKSQRATQRRAKSDLSKSQRVWALIQLTFHGSTGEGAGEKDEARGWDGIRGKGSGGQGQERDLRHGDEETRRRRRRRKRRRCWMMEVVGDASPAYDRLSPLRRHASYPGDVGQVCWAPEYPRRPSRTEGRAVGRGQETETGQQGGRRRGTMMQRVHQEQGREMSPAAASFISFSHESAHELSTSRPWAARDETSLRNERVVLPVDHIHTQLAPSGSETHINGEALVACRSATNSSYNLTSHAEGGTTSWCISRDTQDTFTIFRREGTGGRIYLGIEQNRPKRRQEDISTRGSRPIFPDRRISYRLSQQA